MSIQPTITVIVLNYNGRRHLERCFASLAQVEYPRDRLELMLVDNGSTDGSVDTIRTAYPDVRIVALPNNVGFGAGNNAGAEVATTSHVVFLNNDMRVAPSVLNGFVEALTAWPGAVAAGAKILNWDGSEFDFAGGGLHFSGMGYQEAYGEPFDADRFTDVERILFPCGGAMIVDREVFLDSGGFDADFFAFFEDTDLGWRLWILGHEVVFAPQAVVYHVHHGTADRFADHKKRVLYHRNSLASAFKNYGQDILDRIMAAGVLGTIDGLVSGLTVNGRIDLTEFQMTEGTRSKESIKLSLEEVGVLVAIRELVDDLPSLMRKRDEIQRQRRRSDDEIVDLFRRPFKFWPFVTPSTQASLVRAFGVQDAFAATSRRVLLFSPDILPYPGLPTVGSGLRAWGLAQALKARGHDVVLSMPQSAVEGREDDLPPEAVATAWDDTNMRRLVRLTAPDVVVVCGWPVLTSLRPEKIHVPVVLDQPGPHFLERRYQQFATDEINRQTKVAALRKADYFTSSGARQHGYFARWLADAEWTQDEIESRTRSIPYSLSPELPEHEPSDGLTLVYGGVFLPWQDPTIALEIVVDELERRDEGLLHLYGGSHPLSAVRSERISDLYARLELSSHVKRHELVPYEELIRVYSSADVAVDLMARNPERELAFTTRTVVYLWCGLPVIYNDYSELSEYIAQYDAGWTLDPSDVDGIRAVMSGIFADPALVARKSENAQRLVREELDWTKTIEPLDWIVRHATLRRPRPVRKPKPPRMPRDASALERIRWAYRAEGVAEVARRTMQATRRRLARSIGSSHRSP